MDRAEKSFRISNLKDFLQGDWRLERRLTDRRSGQVGHLFGAAGFTPEGGGLLYREEGRLSFGDYEGSALQAYRYSFAAPARAAVHFADGRFFHDLDLSQGAWRCTHLCGDDRYEGEFAAEDTGSWRVAWRVGGPRKDLILDSRYRRRL